MKTNQYLLSCEHGGNLIPQEYQHLFKGKEEVLYTHKAIDFGALRLAKQLAKASGLTLYASTISRLLVEANRSPDQDALFSEYSKKLGKEEKQRVLDQYYYPHRKKVEEQISQHTLHGQSLLHLAVHTFTPALEGEVREADIGILFDPARPLEQNFADAFKQAVQAINPQLKILYNSPYPGTDDGFPTYLRKKFGKEIYGGIELEVNQKYFLDAEGIVWEELVQEIVKAFLQVKRLSSC